MGLFWCWLEEVAVDELEVPRIGVEVEYLQHELLVTRPHHNVEEIFQHNPYYGHVSRPYILCTPMLGQVLESSSS